MVDLNVSANVRAEVGRARRSGASVARSIGMSYAGWKRRMDDPDLWKLTELQDVARELRVSLDVLTRPEERR